jgi:SEC-C motif
LDPSTAVPPGRNEPCHCGSGKKYKNCHLDKDEAALRAVRTRQSEAGAPVEEAKEPDEEAKAAAPTAPAPPKHATHQPWKKGGSSTNTRGFQRMSAPRKVGGGG